MPTPKNKPETVRISIPAATVTSQDVLAELQGQFTQFEIKDLGKNRILVQKGKSIGLYIKVSKKAIYLQSNFPTAGGKVLFAFSLILLGVIIPLLVYLIAFGKRMRTMRKSVAQHLTTQYGK